MPTELVAAVIGAVTATAGVILIELLWKPAKARQRAAAAILAEMKLNVRLLGSIKASQEEQPGKVADTVFMSTRAWDAVALDLHQLPSDLLGTLLLRYGQFDEIGLMARNYARKVDGALSLPLGSPQLAALAQEIESDSQVFAHAIESSLTKCPATIAQLQAGVDPVRWSLTLCVRGGVSDAPSSCRLPAGLS